MKLLRPWPLTITGVCLFIVWMWFGLSGIDCDGTSTLSALRTAGWFYLGFGGIVPFGFAYSAFFAFLARRLHGVIGWSALMITSGCLIFFAVKAALPTERLTRIVGHDAAQVSTIHCLREHDSFNEGRFACGVISGPDDLMGLIVAHRRLALSTRWRLHVLQQFLPSEPIPDSGDAYRDERSTFYQDPNSGRVYFIHRSSLPRR